MSYCKECDTTFVSRQTLSKHRQRKHAHQKDITNKVINNVVQRAGLDKNSISTNTPSYLPKSPTMDAVVPFQAVNPVKPHTAIDIDGKSNSEESTTSEYETEEEEIEYNNIEKLKNAFKNLYNKLHHNIDIYNELVLFWMN